MPIDPTIALQVRGPKFDNIQDLQARGLQIRQLQRADQDAERAQAEQQTLRDLYRGSLKADGTVDSQRFIQGVAQAGLGDRIPEIQKGLLESDRLRAQTRGETTKADEGDLNLHKKRLDMLSGGLASLLSNPDVTHDDVIAQINNFVNQGLITPEQGAEAARNTPGRPEQLRPFLVQKALEAADASKRLESVLPKYNEQDRGGTINQGTIDPLTAQRTAGTDITKTLTPGEIQSGKNAETLASAGGSVQTDSNTGQMIFVPNKVPQGQPVVPRVVTDAGGAPVAGKSLNDSQSKALLFASRMQASNKVLEDLAAKGVNRPSIAKQGAEAIPVVGGLLGAVANATMASPEQQQVEQAQRDFINATLRRESGATISPSEWDNGKKQYFPQIGDSPEVIAQKKNNRELAMRGILAEVPEGMRGQINAPAEVPAAAAQSAQPASARPPLDAIFGNRK